MNLSIDENFAISARVQDPLDFVYWSVYEFVKNSYSQIINFFLHLLQLTLSDEAAKVVYQMKRASSVRNNNNSSNTVNVQKKTTKKKKAVMEAV